MYKSVYRWAAVGSILAVAAPGLAQVVSYEASSTFPDEEGWMHLPTSIPCDRWLEDGMLNQYCEMGTPEQGERDSYRRSIAEFAGTKTFFLEWVTETHGSQEGIPAVAPAVMSAFGTIGILYHTTISEDLIRFLRDTTDIPYVFVSIEPRTPHAYRLELFGDQLYRLYVDGVLQDEGIPEGAYPTSDSEITFRGTAYIEPVTTRWGYVRYGVIPTGLDFNNDLQVDAEDYYFFHECLTTPSGSWPGCAWADGNFDGQVTCDDWSLFLDAWTDANPPPVVPECMCGLADLNDTSAVDAADLALLLGGRGPDPAQPADLNGDDVVNASDLALLLGAWGPCE